MRLTLDGAWTKCLKQWRWIGRQIKAGDKRGVFALKEAWLEKNDPGADMDADCYFCEYADMHGKRCEKCPGRQIDATFYCMNPAYDFEDAPLAFVRKIEQLNRKRLAKKNNRKGKTK